MFYVDANESETLLCKICEQPFHCLQVSWLASPPDGGEGIWGHRHCLEKHGVRLFGGLRYRLRRGDQALRSLIQRLMTRNGQYPIVRGDRGG